MCLNIFMKEIVQGYTRICCISQNTAIFAAFVYSSLKLYCGQRYLHIIPKIKTRIITFKTVHDVGVCQVGWLNSKFRLLSHIIFIGADLDDVWCCVQRGCPLSWRAMIWRRVLGVRVDDLDVMYYDQLRQHVLQHELLVDSCLLYTSDAADE